MTQPRLLLTNDDGVDSPALLPFARALAARHDVSVAVPDGERSWTGKAISRHEPITLDRVERDGLELNITSGTPADAVQLGLHHLEDHAHDILVSGINLGYNHGTAFLLSSGTVGAALEGWVAGCPAVAFSTGTVGATSLPGLDGVATFRQWHEWVQGPEATEHWTRVAGLCALILDEIVESGLLEVADMVSVNVPWDATEHTGRRVTHLARVGYGSLFEADADGRYHHRHVQILPMDDEDFSLADIEAARSDVVSITPVVVPATPQVPSSVRARLELETATDPDT